MNSPKKETDPLAGAINLLSSALRELTGQKQDEFDWLKSHAGLATKRDLKEMENRLIDAIKKAADISPAIEAAVRNTQAALDRLDDLIPDKE